MAWIQVIVMAICATLVFKGVISKDLKEIWRRPGCHKVGHSRTIEIPDCVQFSISTNACRGYCESFAVPSAPYANGFKIPKPVTSVGQCCNIMETEDVNVLLSCVGGSRNVTFKSATKCSCYHCKKD